MNIEWEPLDTERYISKDKRCIIAKLKHYWFVELDRVVIGDDFGSAEEAKAFAEGCLDVYRSS